MPTYDYECEACGHKFDHFQSMSSNKLRTCPECKKKKLIRLVGAGAGVIFKGSGFYETDYKRSGSSKRSDESGSKGESKSDEGSNQGSGSKKDSASESSGSKSESGASQASEKSSKRGDSSKSDKKSDA